MSDTNPMFVKVTGPGRYQIKAYSSTGWLIMGGWIVLHVAILLLLLIPNLREQWWIVVALDLLITIPFILFAIRNAEPIERVKAAQAPKHRGRRL
ncbi:MAG TPA: hypothetical protein VEY69_10320 [Lautropia sp.]|nr:hypothetical protein [Lautropia sp.]